MHVGQAAEPDYIIWLSQVAIDKINSLIAKEDIRFVIITGDITDSGMPFQWAKAKSLLDQLKVRVVISLLLFSNHSNN